MAWSYFVLFLGSELVIKALGIRKPVKQNLKLFFAAPYVYLHPVWPKRTSGFFIFPGQMIDYFKQKMTSDKANAIYLQKSKYGFLRLLYGLLF